MAAWVKVFRPCQIDVYTCKFVTPGSLQIGGYRRFCFRNTPSLGRSFRYLIRLLFSHGNLFRPSRFLFSLIPAGDSLRFSPVARVIVESRLRQYQGNNEQRETTLKQLFTEAGCDAGRLTEQSVEGSKLPNVICTLPGDTGKVIIVGAHYDHVREGDGVVDNWSGASLLPSLYQSLNLQPRHHTYIFIGFTDEELGEIGSSFYAREMTKEQVAVTDAMVNMDTLGLAPTEVWVSHADKKLTGILIYLAKLLNTPLAGENVDQIGSTDSVQFSARKIPSITIHSRNQKNWDERILHTSKDRIAAMNLDDYYESYRLITAYLVFLGSALSAPLS
jgi:peptidase M28-like protein